MNRYIEPDLDFITEIKANSGENLKKCYQCATCSVVCKLSSDEKPFPRKEMIYAAWGLKDRLIANPNIWSCYNCGDCSTYCPRGAMPGEVMGVLRKMTIKEYARPSAMHKLVNDARMLPLLFFIPALVLLVMGAVTGMMDFHPEGDSIVFAHFFPVPLIEMIFIPLSMAVALVFFFGLKRFISDMKKTHAVLDGVKPESFKMDRFLKILFSNLSSIIRHKRFSNCSENSGRKLSHMMVSFSFFSLAFVAGAFVFALYILNSHGPYSQINPIKILANVAGISLIAGSLMMIRDRKANPQQTSTYFDWYLLGISFCLGVTGMLTQLIRLLDVPWAAYSMYFIHLVMVFNLIALLPYTKLAHLVYRSVAQVFDIYTRAR